MAAKALRSIFQIKITLNFINPPIWRRLLLDSTARLSDYSEELRKIDDMDEP